MDKYIFDKVYALFMGCTHFLWGVRKLYQNRYLHTQKIQVEPSFNLFFMSVVRGLHDFIVPLRCNLNRVWPDFLIRKNRIRCAVFLLENRLFVISFCNALRGAVGKVRNSWQVRRRMFRDSVR